MKCPNCQWPRSTPLYTESEIRRAVTDLYAGGGRIATVEVGTVKAHQDALMAHLKKGELW